MEPIRLRLCFEWGGGALWPTNSNAVEQFDLGPVEDRLDLPDDLTGRIEALSRHHDTALNWNDPAAPGPWSADDHAAFCAAVGQICADLSKALGSDYEVVAEQFDCPSD